MTVVAVVVAVIAVTVATATAVTAVIAVIAVISATARMVDFVVPVGRVRYERAYSTACAGAINVDPSKTDLHAKMSPPRWGTMILPG